MSNKASQNAKNAKETKAMIEPERASLNLDGDVQLHEYAYAFRARVNADWVENQDSYLRLASDTAPPGYETLADIVARWACFAAQDEYLTTKLEMKEWMKFAWNCIRFQVQNNSTLAATLFNWSRCSIPPAMSRCRWFINRDKGYWNKWIAGEYTKEGE